ncbi:coiled-coil domain-containing protein 30-like isoform X2 [Narcine bancroftii]|uniref:coiled-coil domain-containing protein 30-like isoform X2 n=2 Tax=Narcine bancroftii TaxID=1343680 RepID=UPI00383170F2
MEMESSGEEKVELEDILNRLKEDGINTKACSANEHLCHLWHIYQRSEAKLQATKQDLNGLQKQQATEMMEVENYVDHIRNLLVEREAVMAENERENELLRAQLQQLKQEQEMQVKEVKEMLDQEGLADITHSGSSEQVAYLLVERATLLEKLELAERKVEDVTGNLHGIHLQTHEAGLLKERKLRERAEKDLDEAAQRLQMAHEEIRRLTDELDMEKKVKSNIGNHSELRWLTSSPDLWVLRCLVRSMQGLQTLQQVERLQKIQQLQTEPSSNPEAMEKVTPPFKSSNFNLSRDPAQQLNSQQQLLMDVPLPSVRKEKKPDGPSHTFTKDSLNQDVDLESVTSDIAHSSYDIHHPRSEELHKRCHHEISQLENKNHELHRKLHKLQQELEEVTLRNESLESTLEHYRHRSKDDKHGTDCEKEVLRAKVNSMEADYAKLKRKYKELKVQSHGMGRDQNIQEHDKKTNESLESMQLRLEEEMKKHKDLESSLAVAEEVKIQKEEELQGVRAQVHHLSLELKNYRAAADQNKMLNQVLDRMKEENCTLEQKFNKVVEDYKDICKKQNEASNSDWKEVAEGYLSQIAELKSSKLKLQEALNSNMMTDASEKKVECLQQQLDAVLKENQQLNQENLVVRQQFCTNQQGSQILNQEYATIRQQFLCYQQENKILTQENCKVQQQLASCQQENQCLTQEVCNIQQQLNDLIHSKEKVEDSINQVQLQALKMEMSHMQSSLEFEQKNSCQQKQTLELQLEEANNRVKSQEALLAQHAEEARKLRQDLQRAHNLCSSAEKELKYKREQLIDLQKQNSLLDQENTRLNLDFKTVQCRLSEMDKHTIMLKSECEIKQQRLKELEMDSSKTPRLLKQIKCMQEDLATERNRNISAEKKSAELQQQLSCIQHQLRLSEARNKERVTLEAELKESRETAAKLKNQLQEETLQRKLADQNTEELQQQIKSMQEKEGCLSRGKCDLQQQLQQQEARLQVLEEEKEAMCSENLCLQKTNKKFTDDLCSCKQEVEKLKEELQNILQQLDTQIRNYNEKQLRHKQKLHKAKEIFIREVMLRDGKIKHLETEVKLMKNLMDKEHAWNMKVTYENDLLLVEKRELLQQLHEQESGVRDNTSAVCNVKHKSACSGVHTPLMSSATKTSNERAHRKSQKSTTRISYLEEENKQLQDETLKLSERLGSLENSLKIIKMDPGKLQHHDSLSVSFAEDPCKFLYSDTSATNGNFLPSTCETPSPSGSNNIGSLDVIRRGKTLECSDATQLPYSPSRLWQSDVGYLNLSSHSHFRDQDEGQSLGNDDV